MLAGGGGGDGGGGGNGSGGGGHLLPAWTREAIGKSGWLYIARTLLYDT